LDQAGLARARLLSGLAQQRQNSLWNLVGLSQNRSTSLLQDLSTSPVRDFDCVGGVFNTRTRSGQVGHRVVQVGDGGLATVLHRTVDGAQVVHVLDSLVDGCQWGDFGQNSFVGDGVAVNSGSHGVGRCITGNGVSVGFAVFHDVVSVSN